MYKEVFPKILDFSDEKYVSYRLLEKKRSVAASRIENRARAKMTSRGDKSDVKYFVLVARCPTRDAGTERLFLQIHNSRIYHPYNFKVHIS